ncbi:MAG: hypothetical protein Kow0080_01400 [Candidatus Promineifilaceae bacterium]
MLAFRYLLQVATLFGQQVKEVHEMMLNLIQAAVESAFPQHDRYRVMFLADGNVTTIGHQLVVLSSYVVVLTMIPDLMPHIIDFIVCKNARYPTRFLGGFLCHFLCL